tara:strand:- start:3744 stop:4877 length:1134 start_codon:yes stop_codon:yes gene_type:complete
MIIPFSKTEIMPKDIKLVNQVLRSGWLTHGKYTNLFENEFKKYTSSRYAITVSSCTAALHLSCLASGFKKGDEVIVPAMSHTATSHCVEYTGAKAVFADVDKVTGNISFEEIKKKFSKKTKGIIIVHMAGISADLEKIIKFCNKKNIKLIEDCAHALGTFYKKKHVGNLGVTGCFSFYPTKQVTTGEGGILITNSKKIYNEIKKIKAFGIDKDITERKKQGDYDVKALGFNYRMTDFQACLGYMQLKRYKKNLIKRKLIAKRYVKNLKKIKNITFPNYNMTSSYFIFQILCKKKRDSLLKFFKDNKIGVSVHYKRHLPSMSYYKEKYNLKDKNFKNAKYYAENNISLPNYPKLYNKEVDYICNKIKNFYKRENQNNG